VIKDSVALFYCAEGSDKEYHCHIDEQPVGCTVAFAFGRRGSTLQTGTKTPAPVPYEKAKSIFDKLVREKQAKGYSAGSGGDASVPAPYMTAGIAERQTGIFPQLLNPIDENEVNGFIKHYAYCAQEKLDGKRMLLRKEGDKITAINRKGLECGFPIEFAKEALAIPSDFIIDGESIGNVFYAFDILSLKGQDVKQQPYSQRHALLFAIMGGNNAMRCVPMATSQTGKQELLSRLQQNRKEGIVFKLLSAPYTPGRPDSGGTQLKFKFTATATCLVKSVHASKRSVLLEMLDENAVRVEVGNCTIPPNKSIPPAQAKVEIRYLYAYKGGSLYQPVFLGQRDDVEETACVLSQLKYKADEEE